LDISGKSTSDLSEGSNLYYTDARADARINLQTGSNLDLSSKNTGDLSEGTNLYYTDTRADARVNLQTGANLDLSSKSTSDLSEGTNLYYTDTRFDNRLATKTTSDLTEGTNLYYTDTRFDNRLATKTTSNLSEGSNLYYTDARVDARIAAASIDDLSDVDITTTVPTNGQVLTWNTTSNKFVPSDDLTGIDFAHAENISQDITLNKKYKTFGTTVVDQGVTITNEDNLTIHDFIENESIHTHASYDKPVSQDLTVNDNFKTYGTFSIADGVTVTNNGTLTVNTFIEDDSLLTHTFYDRPITEDLTLDQNYKTVGTFTVSDGVTLTTNNHTLSIYGEDNSKDIQFEYVTADINAKINKCYFVDTNNSEIVITLPSNPGMGDKVKFIDVVGNFANNNLQVTGYGNKIQGSNSTLVLSTNRMVKELIFVNTGIGWVFNN
jgi:hypothetical protein